MENTMGLPGSDRPVVKHRKGRYATKRNGRWKKALRGPCPVCRDGLEFSPFYCARCRALRKEATLPKGHYHGKDIFLPDGNIFNRGP